MANALTGDYDAVVEVSVNSINAILATLHQNGASADASPTFLHSFALRVGDPPKITLPHIAALLDWMGALKQAGRGDSSKAVSDKAPPGASAGLSEAVKEMHDAHKEVVTPGTVRGMAQVQLSTPRVTFPPKVTDEVTAHIDLRARYLPDPGTLAMPEFIRGEVRVTVTAKPVSLSGYGKTLLEVAIPADDNKIKFVAASGSGLGKQEIAQIETRIRTILRQQFEPTNVELPKGFQFHRFKGLGSGSNQAAALPVQLSAGPQPPAAAINSVNNLFIGATDAFALAVAKDYIVSLVQPSLDAVKSTSPQFKVKAWLLGTAVYTVTFTQATATWSNGKIRIVVQGHAKTPAWWAPNVKSFKVQQDLALELDVAVQSLKVVPAGEPSVSVSVGGPFGGSAEKAAKPIVRDRFIAERDKALASAHSQIQKALAGGGNLNKAPKAFDATAHAEFKSGDTTADGVILRGSIATKARSDVVTQYSETGDEAAYTALQSWIPAGTIEQFEWSWVEATTPAFPWGGKTNVVTDKHRFILPKSGGVPPGSRFVQKPSVMSKLCLRVVGKQLTPTGGWKSVAGGQTCSVDGPDFVFTMPPWWDKIMAPIWEPDPPPDAILEEAIAAHLDVLASSRPPHEQGANSIVHFVDLEADQPLEALKRAWSQVSGREAAVALILVLPRGAFRSRRADLEQRLGAVDAFSGSLVVTEDYEGGWTRTFAAERAPATYLIDARGAFVWKRLGQLDAGAFAAALDQHLLGGDPAVRRQARLAVQPGSRAPDVQLQTDEEHRFGLRKLRGSPVLLNFWQSWSAPCLRELRRLQRLHQDMARELVIIAINGGEGGERIASVRREHDLTLGLAADPGLQITRAYGVTCWPTTISIDADGIVGSVKFGAHND